MSAGYFKTKDRFNGDVDQYGNMFELVKRVPGSAAHVCFLRNQIPRHTTSALPRLILITYRAALILYGRSCDRNHCLVYRHFYKVGACLPFALFLFSVLVDFTLVLHIAASCHLAPQLIASPQSGHKNFQVPSRWGAIRLVIGYQRVPSGYIFSLANV